MKENYLYIKFILMSVSLTIALAMLNAPYLLISIVAFLVVSPLIFHSNVWATLILTAYNIVRPIFYVWATVVTVQGKQDFLAIAFYVLAVLQVISIIKNLIGTVMIIFTSLFKN